MDPMEDRFLVSEGGPTNPRRKFGLDGIFLTSCRPHLLLLPIILFALYAYNQSSSPATVSGSWVFRHHKGLGPHGHKKDCESKHFKKETMKLLMEFPFAGLLFHNKLSKYEASGVIRPQGSAEAIVVFDNAFSIARLDHSHMHNVSHPTAGPPRRPPHHASLLTWPGDTGEDSGFEFIAYNESAGVYIVGQESVTHDDEKERAVTYDVTFNDTSVIVGTRCVADFEFSHKNKGFEGAIVVTTTQGESLLIGLCEGNNCVGGDEGKEAGNGRLVVMKRVMRKEECRYATVDRVKLPTEVNFQDYSAITVWNETTVAIASQENAAVFIGELDLDGGVKVTEGKIIDFPRNDQCEIKYCNIEGVTFLDEKTIVAVSDSMKSGGKQHFRCREKDESVAIFQLP